MFHRNPWLAAPVFALAVALGADALAGQASDRSTTMPVTHEHQHGDVTIVDKVAGAKTAADHEAIAQHFDAEAARFDEQAALHQRLARTYRTGGAAKGVQGTTMAKHCDRLVKDYVEAAKTQREMAAMHREMAGTAGH